jgi:transcription-repair coupling factor (superfamily II helicase)
VISEQDVLGDRMVAKPRRKRKAENFLREVDTLSPGDLVVHVEHGVGRYLGIETITALGAPHACVMLEYAENAKLYLPVENIELLSRYGHEEGLLDRLGGGAWQAKKAKLKERIKEIADRLMRIAAERALRHAPILEAPHSIWEAFAARFPYQETDDQLAAIADVVADLEKGSPMDRLIVGDVGFGKTEVAMRAAFVAALSGMQVAVICPTTLLARQHYRSFAERFRGFPISVKPLSRFVSAKDANATRAAIADGSVDIVVGTHALLAKGINFKNLGLLIIDEEQHFGVAHKERLKEMRVRGPCPDPDRHAHSAHVATVADRRAGSVDHRDPAGGPSGDPHLCQRIRHDHPPRGAVARTVPGRAVLLCGAAHRRPARGRGFPEDPCAGSVYVIAHGQLAAGDLDDRMNQFYDGKYDVLLATSDC